MSRRTRTVPAASDKDVDHVHDDVCDLTDHSSYERELFSIRRVVGLAGIELVISEILEAERQLMKQISGQSNPKGVVLRRWRWWRCSMEAEWRYRRAEICRRRWRTFRNKRDEISKKSGVMVKETSMTTLTCLWLRALRLATPPKAARTWRFARKWALAGIRRDLRLLIRAKTSRSLRWATVCGIFRRHHEWALPRRRSSWSPSCQSYTPWAWKIKLPPSSSFQCSLETKQVSFN